MSAPREPGADGLMSLPAEARVWRLKVLVATWLSYAGFYFCRKNFAIVKSSLIEALGTDKSGIAHLFTVYLAAYMVGQFVSGYLGHRTGTRVLLLVGMALTLACNVLFGFAYLLGPAGYWPLMVLMAVNGLAQSAGWPGNVGVLSNWLRRPERGRLMAIWATCYQIGSILAKTFAAFMLAMAGALWSFWGAAAVMLGVWLVFYKLQRDNPEDVGLAPIVAHGAPPESSDPHGTAAGSGRRKLFEGWDRETFFTVLSMGCCYFVFKFLRYALDSWAPLAIKELFDVTEATAGYISTSFDWVGFVGVLAGGWVSDRFFSGRRYQTVVLMTVGMALAFGFLAVFGMRSVWFFGVGLSLCGFMLMGPDSLLSGVGAIDVGGRHGAVVAAGVINGLGSIGPIFQEELLGWMLDRHGYQASFYLMIGVSLLGVLGTLYLAWRARRGLSAL